MTTHEIAETAQQERIERAAVRATLSWSGWGSPVGLALLLVSIGVFLVCLHQAGIVG